MVLVLFEYCLFAQFNPACFTMGQCMVIKLEGYEIIFKKLRKKMNPWFL